MKDCDPTLERTDFAPADRVEVDQLTRQNRSLRSQAIINRLLDAYPEPAMILNSYRQIVLANDKLSSLMDATPDELIGLRPGEAVGCIHATETESGCGTTLACRFCGGVRAILQSQMDNSPANEDCRLTVHTPTGPSALDLRVWGTPLELDGDNYTVFAIRDRTDENRRACLEMVFFHDILNSMGGLRGLLEVWSELTGESAEGAIEKAKSLADHVIDEIEAQRDLASAERGDLQIIRREIDVASLLTRLCDFYHHHPAARGKLVIVQHVSGQTRLETDTLLLSRSIGNLIKNGLEASEPGQRVSISYHGDPEPRIEIHNEAVIPEAVAYQIFQRSFSTKKGRGHGLGTYSVRLLVERYLGGSVSFESLAGRGTTFSIRLSKAA